MGKRLDEAMVGKGLAQSRSQAQRLIKLGRVTVNREPAYKPHKRVSVSAKIAIKDGEKYVSRAGFKLASIADKFKLDFQAKTVLDVGSSTGGFSDYALQHNAQKVVAVDVGVGQLHRSLRSSERIELHEKTDIRNYKSATKPDIILIDVSFISLRDILPHIAKEIAGKNTEIIAMLKPQFEAGAKLKNRGVIKNNAIRRTILKDFEGWVKNLFVIIDKADSKVAGAKGNLERFYKLALPKR